MTFLMDTCTWMHLFELYVEKQYDFRGLLSDFKWGLTEEVKEEIIHFQIDEYVKLDEAYVFPITLIEFEQFQKMYPSIVELDKADQTLLLIGKREEQPIITDDTDLFLEAKSMGLECYLLPLFILKMVEQAIISKKDGRKILKYWEDNKNYVFSDIKKWKASLNLL